MSIDTGRCELRYQLASLDYKYILFGSGVSCCVMKNQTILAVKGIAILGVVLHHVANRRFEPGLVNQLSFVISAFTWCVLVFISVAGWLHSASEERGRKSLAKFVIHRARRLLVPFAALMVLYASIWQFIQFVGVRDVATRLPVNYMDKLLFGIHFFGHNPVGEQLYFLPFIFLISVVCQAVYIMSDWSGVFVLAIVSLMIGVFYFPYCGNTGATVGVLLWGLACYCAGFLSHRFRYYKNRVYFTLLISLGVVGFLGLGGLAKVVPFLLLECMDALKLDGIPVLARVGEASGTIYAYHSPFILHPLIIMCSFLPREWQFSSVVLAVVACIFICTAFFYILRNTKLKWILL
jgi:hypothetical protein